MTFALLIVSAPLITRRQFDGFLPGTTDDVDLSAPPL